MNYRDLFFTLKKAFNQEENTIQLDELDLTIENHSFSSRSANVLPGLEAYQCEKHDRSFESHYELSPDFITEAYPDSLSCADSSIKENNEFRYSLFKPQGSGKADKMIFLFHGLNERDWNKYLPWAYKLMEQTGSAVLLFPLAFHMNRAPAAWGNPRLMQQVSKEREQQYPVIAQSTFGNAAISTRLQVMPQRFFWSGLQTYQDVIRIVRQIRKGEHNSIAKEAKVDFFAYSIGSFLSEILMLTNPNQLFDASKLLMFCGGPTLDRMYPVSRYILDSEANIALYSFFIEHLENEFKQDQRLNHYFNEDHPAGKFFYAMLSYPRNKSIREERFSALSGRIKALALRNDEVIPPAEIMNTLQGDLRDIPNPVQVYNFPFSCSHVKPFNESPHDQKEVNRYFEEVFETAGAFLK